MFDKDYASPATECEHFPFSSITCSDTSINKHNANPYYSTENPMHSNRGCWPKQFIGLWPKSAVSTALALSETLLRQTSKLGME